MNWLSNRADSLTRPPGWAFGMAWGLPLSLNAPAATNISGVVTDSITGQPVAGAQVTLSIAANPLSIAANPLGARTTEADGVFQLMVNVPAGPAPQILSLQVAQPGYVNPTLNVVVSAGQADQLSYKVALARVEARNCAPNWERTVVVGFVRQSAAAAAGDLALSRQVGEVLQYDLSSEIQKTRLPPARQPIVLACPDAQPRPPSSPEPRLCSSSMPGIRPGVLSITQLMARPARRRLRAARRCAICARWFV